MEFILEDVDHIRDDRCTADVRDYQAMDGLKAAFHEGNTTTLNVVFVLSNYGSGTKGVCVLPNTYENVARSVGTRDGCVCAMDTLPREGFDSSSFDSIISHELGHALSCEHVKDNSNVMVAFAQ